MKIKKINKIRQILRNILSFLGIRNLYIRYIIYNRVIMKLLTWANHLRWQKIDRTMVLWPPAAPLFDQIIEYISNQYEILSFEVITIHDEKFEDFIHELYEIDFANLRKVALKIDHLLSSPLYNLGIVKVRIPKPTIIVQDALNRVRCDSIGDLKDKIRKKYRKKIPNYIYDVIVHSTEVDYQNKKVSKILKKYSSSTLV